LSKKAIIALFSYHHGNTEKVARVFAEALGAEILKPEDIPEADYGRIVGFGSGIYGEKHHKSLRDLADRLPRVEGKGVFIFSTMGIPVAFGESSIQSAIPGSHRALRERLESKGYVIAGEFSCPGFNTNMFLRHLGGVNKGRPNAADLERACGFIEGIKAKL
jgi:flavodoxin